jgi:hypothetical protein
VNFLSQPINSVRIIHNEETDEWSMYLDMYNEDPKNEWHFRLDTVGRPTLHHLEMLTDMAERAFISIGKNE